MKKTGPFQDIWNKKWSIALSVIMTAVLFGVVGVFFDSVYPLNDDLMLQSILSGKFSAEPSGMAVYLSIPLSSTLSFFYRMVPHVPWLGVFFTGCYMLCFFLALNSTLKSMERRCELAGKRRILRSLFICLLAGMIFWGFFFGQYLMTHYTVTAAVVGGTALYCFLISEASREWRTTLWHTCPSVLLLLLCYLIRTKVFYMVLPFLAVAGIYRMLKTKSIVNYLAPLGLLAAGFLALFLIGEISYNRGAWREYTDYNDARTELYDYVGVWEGEEAAAYYAGLGYSEEEIAVYRNYDILLNETLTADDFERIASYAELRPEGKRTAIQKLRDGIWLYKERLMGNGERVPYQMIVILLYFLTAILLIATKDWSSLFSLVLLGMARSALWIYLFSEGRYPERVTISLVLIELLVLLAVLWNVSGEVRRFKRGGVQFFAAVCVVVMTAVIGCYSIPDALKSHAEQIAVNREEDKIYDYMKAHPDNLYLLDVYATVYHTEYVLKDYDFGYENYLLLGGWTAGSPHIAEKLEKWGYASAFDALARGENVFLVLKDGTGLKSEELERYIAWRTGEKPYMERVETVETGTETFGVYRYVRVQPAVK